MKSEAADLMAPSANQHARDDDDWQESRLFRALLAACDCNDEKIVRRVVTMCVCVCV